MIQQTPVPKLEPFCFVAYILKHSQGTHLKKSVVFKARSNNKFLWSGEKAADVLNLKLQSSMLFLI